MPPLRRRSHLLHPHLATPINPLQIPPLWIKPLQQRSFDRVYQINLHLHAFPSRFSLIFFPSPLVLLSSPSPGTPGEGWGEGFGHSSFDILSSFVIRHSSFLS